jgi:hypothetical protein
MPRKAKDQTAEVLAKSEEQGLAEISGLIQAARENTLRTVTTALIDLHWQIGQTLSRRVQAAEWGEGVVDRLAAYLARTQPGLRGLRAPICSACVSSTRSIVETKSRTAGATIAVDTQPDHLGAE